MTEQFQIAWNRPAMEKQKIETTAFEDWEELFPWFVSSGLGCLLLSVALENTRLRRLP